MTVANEKVGEKRKNRFYLKKIKNTTNINRLK